MNTLNRYNLKEFFRLTGLVLACLVGVYLIVEFFERIDDFVEHHSSITNALLYFLYKLPLIIYQITPVAILFPTILLMNQLIRTGELIAIRTCGISLLRMTAPLIVVSLLVSAFVFTWGEFVVGQSLKQMDYVYKTKITGQSSNIYQQYNIWVKTGREEIWNISRFQPAEMKMLKVVIFSFDENKALKMRVDAQSVVKEGERWLFRGAYVRNFTDGQITSTRFLDSAILPLNISLSDLKAQSTKPERTSFREMRRNVKKRRAVGLQSTALTVDMHSKLSYPLASLVMVLLGIPFSLGWERGGKLSRGILMGIIISVFYWVLFFAGISLGHSGLLPPVLAAWGANILLSLLGLYMILGVRQ